MGIRDGLLAIFVAFAFVAWAVWGKYYKVHPIMLGIMSATLLAFTVTIFSLGRLYEINSFFSLKSFFIMFFLCVLNGVGFYLYASKIASPLVRTGDYVGLVAILMLTEARFLDMYLNGNSMNGVNYAGIFIIILGVFCFTR
ncbi:MAG TPA: hypothetical protein VJH05_02270 [Candidatus Paceibacterota bacterium]